MLKWIESTGKSEEAAIEAALQKLGMDRDEVSVEILERAKSGFLGIGSCPAKVKVSYEAPDEPEERPAPAEITHAEAEPVKAAEPAIREICELEAVQNYSVRQIDLGTGTISCVLQFPEELFYSVLSEQSGFDVKNDGDLIGLLEQLSSVKREYDKVANALDEVRATGYGVVMPSTDEMHLEVPEIIHKGSSYGVKLKASAPSIHMMRADIETEISPMVGDEKQSEDLVQYLLGEYEDNTEKLWESNIFGKSVYELVSEGLNTKLKRMPDDARLKLKQTLSRIINEGSGGLICIIL